MKSRQTKFLMRARRLLDRTAGRARRSLSLAVAAGLVAALVVAASGSGGVAAGPAGQDDFGACGDAADPISAIQGSGDRTPAGGQLHTVEGVVVLDVQDSTTEYGGFFMQEEAADQDSDPLTSEGIFIDSSLSDVDVAVGDVVRVTGTAFEYRSDGVTLTQLRRVDEVVVCESGASVDPVEVTLPVADPGDLERYEGMLVTFPQELTATQMYNLGRYGEVMLSVDGRLFQPTQVALPGEAALAVLAENERRAIILDDGDNTQNLDPTVHPPGGLAADNVLRSGYTVVGVTGVMDHRYDTYRVHPTQPVTFTASNPRPAAPDDVGGRLRVASFNVLNYFNGDGAGDGFPTPRGAETPFEFERQRAKIVNAILALDADVIGLMEIENDGSGAASAIADLVDGLNAAAGAEMYAYIDDPDGLLMTGAGGDAIKQAIIYRPATVSPVGEPVTTLAEPFNIRRPSVTQAFEEVATGEVFVVVGNHFKSKGCSGAGVDPDTGDGQGCWNRERTRAANTLIEWLTTDPTGTGDPDVLLIGDLNAYAMEDPIRAFEAAGYVNLLHTYVGPEDYSYVFFGQAGSLDHAIASADLASQVTGASTWHINADEPVVFDYNVNYKTENHVESLYDPGPYRSSDHDPVVIGLALGEPGTGDDGPGQDSGDGSEDGAGGADEVEVETDNTGGILAIIIGAAAVVVALLSGAYGALKRRSGS